MQHGTQTQTGQFPREVEGLPEARRPDAHCHIAEHHESGMMFSFTVEP